MSSSKPFIVLSLSRFPIRPGRLLFPLIIGAAALTLLVVAFPTLRTAYLTARLVAEKPPAMLPLPVADVPAARLRDSWRDPRGSGRLHQGIDIFAPRDTPIRSTTRGVVLRRGWNRLGGWTITVLGPGGQRHYYAHLERFAVPRAGDWVEAGDVLGRVGSSGNAAGGPPHLHYGIYSASGALNPYPLLRGETAVAPSSAAGATAR